MLFSIIVPVYNIEAYLRTCITHVLHQTFKDYELILIDDGSTDKSGKICDWYADRYSCINVIHQANHGQSYARNVGISAAKGDYILFLDGDDYWYSKSCLKKLSDYIRSNKVPFDVVAYRGIFAYSDGKKTVYDYREVNYWKANESHKGYTGQEFLKTHLKTGHAFRWYPWLYAFSKRLFEDGKLRFPVNRVYEDFFLIWRVLLAADRIGILPELFYVYRLKRPGSSTETVSYKNCRDRLWILEHNIIDVKHTDMDEELKSCLLNNFSQSYVACCALTTLLKNPQRHKMLAQLKKKQRLLDYADSRICVMVRIGFKTIGFKNTICILHLGAVCKTWSCGIVRGINFLP